MTTADRADVAPSAPVGDRPMLIGGELVGAHSGGWTDSISPVDESFLGRVPAGAAEDIDAAVAAAARAFPLWAALDVKQRAQSLRRLAASIQSRRSEIAELEVRDSGNTIGRMLADVDIASSMIEYYAGLGLELKGETVPGAPGGLHFARREPYGVVGRIVAFNHPFQFAASRLAAPLMAGNTIVIKPAHQSPLTATVLAEICAELLPPGVVNIVTGTGPETGEPLVRHPAVKRLAFIGSTATGMAIQRAAAEVAVKHVTLELGGKNPMIVFPDADLGRAMAAAVRGMNFGTTGQSCGSTSRLLLHDDVYDEGVEMLISRVEELRVGDPLDPSTDMGPLNSADHHARVKGYVDVGRDDGAQLLTGGGRPCGERYERGYWLEPTVFGEVTPSMRIFNEEIFGPVLSVSRWKTPEEVVDLANHVQYGLAAAIWTEGLATALQTAATVEAGYVWINGVSQHFAGTSFGGKKNSGLGTEEGLDELLSYTEPKSVHVLFA